MIIVTIILVNVGNVVVKNQIESRKGFGLVGFSRETKIKMTLQKEHNLTIIISFTSGIMMGIKGEFYPCKPDIFEQTYEKV